MDITSLVGPFFAILMIVAGMFAKGAQDLIGDMINASAMLIVLGGTFGCLMVAYPLRDFMRSLTALGTYLKSDTVDLDSITAEIIELANVARKESILALEKMRDGIEFAPLRMGVRLAVDGTDPKVIQELLESEAHIHHQEAEIPVKFWEDFGAFAPTIGILGAVIGLMKVMTLLEQPDKIGPGIAVAFVATLYGVGSANIIALPIGKKLKRKAQIEAYAREAVIMGIEGILTGMNPNVIQDKLGIFLQKSDQEAQQ